MSRHTLFAFLIAFALLLLSGCIEPYDPDDEVLKTGTLVVQAHLSNQPGEQSVVLSRSSTIAYPEFDPFTGCHVEVLNKEGESREFQELVPGNYVFFHEDNFLCTNAEYRLVFVTPEGRQYESEFEKLHEVPEIDSLYYRLENHPGSQKETVEEGVQFYINFEIEKESGSFLRWKVTETYEIQNPEYEAWIFDVDRRLKELPKSDTWTNCWITLNIPKVFTHDLSYVEGACFTEKPLNFVSNGTRRLNIRYSLLVEQMALSQTAFTYWNEQAKNSQSAGALFDSQPALSPGNICNVDDENELVIGFFSVSGLTAKRVFLEHVAGLKTQSNPTYCMPGVYPKYLDKFRLEYLPVYLGLAWVDGARSYGEVNKYCVDCREYKGSSHLKPEFW